MVKKVNLDNTAGSLVVALNAPGMTPMLKAGLGGLAASLRAINEKTNQNKWQNGVIVPLGDGFAKVEETKIIIEWPSGGLQSVLTFLWEESFQISDEVIYLPGAHSSPFDASKSLLVMMQTGLFNTFLQLNKVRETTKEEKHLIIGYDENQYNLSYKPIKSYVHQNILPKIIESTAMKKSINLPGWAYPGAAQRHLKHKETMAEYSPSTAMAALFSIVGCISLPHVLDDGGFLIIPVPTNLVMFASKLPDFLPVNYLDSVPASLGDAVLLAEFYCLINEIDTECISSIHGVLMKSVVDKNQKYRASLVSTIIESKTSHNIELYKIMRKDLPPRFIPFKDKNNTWIRPSYLRAFASDNLVRGLPWYAGFSTYSRVDGGKTRYLHTYKTNNNVGLLEFTERMGLIEMVDKQLPEQEEKLLVQTMHEAIRNRFGQISSDQKMLDGDLKKRFRDERLRIRLTFSNAKTPDLVRKAFADLWSKAGKLDTLRDRWDVVMPFITDVRNRKWMLARDLALIALASYKGNSDENEDDTD